jgi:ankyrin repeat protein
MASLSKIAADRLQAITDAIKNIFTRHAKSKTAMGALLAEAALNGNIGLIEWYLVQGADVNAVFGPMDSTALHMAALNGKADAAEKLLRWQARVDARDNMDHTPLHLAVLKENLDVARVLLQHQAATHLEDPEGKTPLHTTAAKNHPEMIALLLARGADVNQWSEQRGTALFVAAMLGHDESVSKIGPIPRSKTEMASARSGLPLPMVMTLCCACYWPTMRISMPATMMALLPCS